MLRLHTALALCLASTSLAAAPTGPFYEIDDPPSTSVKALDDKRLDSVLADQLKGKGVTAKNLTTGATDLTGLTREVKQALLMGISAKPGAENDLIIEGKGTFTAVEVVYEGATLAYRVGPVRTSLYGAAPTREELQKKYGTGAFVDDGAAWDPNMLFVVDTVLSKLTPAELAVIAGLPFHRMPRDASKRGNPRALAIYRQESDAPARLELYDLAVVADRIRFCGSVDAPVTQSAAMLMHEIGHAISRAASRAQFAQVATARAALDAAANAFNEAQRKQPSNDAAAKAEAARIKGLQQTWQDLSSAAKSTLAQGSDLEKAFLAKLPLAAAPTLYGRTSGAEAFAESFRMWKFDRVALDRAAPGMAAWFDAQAPKP